MPARDLAGWLAYISAQHPKEISLGLDRVQTVYQRLGSPRPPLVITVGGTNGKGSVCAFLERILFVAGYRVGKYTSPHILAYNERVRIGLREAGDQVLASAFERVESARNGVPLTYFEFGTLACLLMFAEARLDVAVLEVGLGGRLDAVNVVDADVPVVVSVDLDHQAYLGNTREAIAFEKAGIYRTGRPAIFGEADVPLSLKQHAESIGATLRQYGRDFTATKLSAQQWRYDGLHGVRHALPVPALRGDYQLRNAAVALAALDEVRDRLPVSIAEIKRGLAEVELAGRLQVLPGRPTIVLDVAHNPHAARVLADALGDMGFYERTIAIFGVMKDKDADAVIRILAPRIDEWLTVDLPIERAATGAALAEAITQAGGTGTAFASVSGAIAAARERAGQNDRILIFGSFHTVAEALRSLQIRLH